MRCPVCQLELGVERQAGEGEIVLTYSVKDWLERCSYQRGDPVLCANLMPTIMELLPERATPFRSEHRPKPTKIE
jgi:hypothetical protein